LMLLPPLGDPGRRRLDSRPRLCEGSHIARSTAMRTPHDPAEDSTPQETMAVVASRLLHEGAVCFVGIGLPSLAANLARHTHAPGLVLVYESGTIGSKPHRLPLSIGDGD